jgi:DNA-binding beta-propeller fold protein YncE
MTLSSLTNSSIGKQFFARRAPLTLAVVLIASFILALRPGAAQTAAYVSTFAGASTAGFADGQGQAARFNAPLGIAIDADDNIIVADFRNARIRKIDPQGNVTTIAGGVQGYANGVGTAARFYGPAGVAIDPTNGNIIVADYGNNRIRQITPLPGAALMATSAVQP